MYQLYSNAQMGGAASVAQRPADASDITNLEEAQLEVSQIRAELRTLAKEMLLGEFRPPGSPTNDDAVGSVSAPAAPRVRAPPPSSAGSLASSHRGSRRNSIEMTSVAELSGSVGDTPPDAVGGGKRVRRRRRSSVVRNKAAVARGQTLLLLSSAANKLRDFGQEVRIRVRRLSVGGRERALLRAASDAEPASGHSAPQPTRRGSYSDGTKQASGSAAAVASRLERAASKLGGDDGGGGRDARGVVRGAEGQVVDNVWQEEQEEEGSKVGEEDRDEDPSPLKNLRERRASCQLAFPMDQIDEGDGSSTEATPGNSLQASPKAKTPRSARKQTAFFPVSPSGTSGASIPTPLGSGTSSTGGGSSSFSSHSFS